MLYRQFSVAKFLFRYRKLRIFLKLSSDKDNTQIQSLDSMNDALVNELRLFCELVHGVHVNRL